MDTFIYYKLQISFDSETILLIAQIFTLTLFIGFVIMGAIYVFKKFTSNSFKIERPFSVVKKPEYALTEGKFKHTEKLD